MPAVLPKAAPFSRKNVSRSLIVLIGLFAGRTAGASYILSVEIARDSPSTLFVSLFDGGVLRSFDAGLSWQPSGPGLPSGNVRKVVSLGTGWWLAATDSGVFRTLDGGDFWTRSSIAVVEPAVFDLAAAPSSGNVVYATTAGGGFRSVDAGASWQPLGTAFPGDSFGRLAVDPTNADRVYGVSIGGFYRSLDGGRTWSKTGFQLFGFALGGVVDVRIDPNHPATVYVLDEICGLRCSSALRRSDDGGDASLATEATDRTQAFVVDSGSVLIAAASDALQRSFDRGATWETVGGEVPLPVSAMAAARSSALVVVATTGGQLYSSTDHGSSWRALADPAPICVAGQDQLCLASRFRVSASFIAPGAPQRAAQPVALTENAAAFWFFSANNLELVVKVVDGRAFNGHHWVFLAGLSNVEYAVTVTDLATGATHLYTNTQGQLRSQADTSSF